MRPLLPRWGGSRGNVGSAESKWATSRGGPFAWLYWLPDLGSNQGHTD